MPANEKALTTSGLLSARLHALAPPPALICSRCGGPRSSLKTRRCRTCHAHDMRAWRAARRAAASHETRRSLILGLLSEAA
jgi:ribosomal protein L40E